VSEQAGNRTRLGKAYESNLRAYSVAMAEAGGGSVQHEEGAVLTIFPHTWWINGVVSPCLPEERALERVEEILAVFRKRGREVWFRLGPSTAPADLAATLKRRNLHNFQNERYMACALSTFTTGFPQPPRVKVYSVEDYGLFDRHPHPLLGRATTARRRCIFEAYERLDRQRPRRHWTFIAEKEGRPAGSAVLYLTAESAAIYDVRVLEEFHRQGIGTALLQEVCTFAREQGAALAVLAASEMGAHFYPRFGFRQVGRYPAYYYSQEKQRRDARLEGAAD
jgi:ribosomal protein S18 acetylase RimI-like enzyme